MFTDLAHLSPAPTQHPRSSRFVYRFTAFFLIVVFTLMLGINVAAAAVGPYIQIQNGSNISITGTEQPQINVQFGNTGPLVSDVRVRCQWDNLIRFTGQAQNGPFQNSQFLPPSGTALAQLNYPATTVTDPALLPNLPTGQNYNVGFNIRLALPAPTFKGPAGSVQCFLLDANFNVLATSGVTTVTVR